MIQANHLIHSHGTDSERDIIGDAGVRFLDSISEFNEAARTRSFGGPSSRAVLFTRFMLTAAMYRSVIMRPFLS